MKITKKLPRPSKGWSGGITCVGNKLYECHGQTTLGIMDRVSGKYIGQLPTETQVGAKDISYDAKENVIWSTPSGGYNHYHKLTMEGKSIHTIHRPQFGFGIFVDPDEPNVLWCADGERKRVLKKSTVAGKVLKEIHLPFKPRGIAKVGRTFWSTKAGELGDGIGVLYHFDERGTVLHTLNFPPSKYAHDAGGISVEKSGEVTFLWVIGGKKTSIYKIDISEYYSPQPSEPDTPDSPDDPTPSPTDEIDEHINFLRKIGHLIADLFGW